MTLTYSQALQDLFTSQEANSLWTQPCLCFLSSTQYKWDLPGTLSSPSPLWCSGVRHIFINLSPPELHFKVQKQEEIEETSVRLILPYRLWLWRGSYTILKNKNIITIRGMKSKSPEISTGWDLISHCANCQRAKWIKAKHAEIYFLLPAFYGAFPNVFLDKNEKYQHSKCAQTGAVLSIEVDTFTFIQNNYIDQR